MSLSYFFVVAFLALAPKACAQPSIGPASFAFPLPRQWNASFDNVPPCGSSSVGLRTEFPLTNGYLVFTSTYETRDLEMKISHNRNPQSVADFSYLVPWRISDYGVGFTCVKIPDAPGGTEPGANATFQIRFASDYDTPLDRSFFVCADITYVEGRDFDRRVPCPNTTDVKFERLPLPRTQLEPPKNATNAWSPGKKKHLSQGAIAGIASVSALAATALLVAVMRMTVNHHERAMRQREVPCVRVPGSYGLPDVVPIRNFFYGVPTRR